MISTLAIERFKSIRSLAFDCRKINVFIGPPDTGKTNILESLFLVSCLGWGRAIGPHFRLKSDVGFDPLFYRQFFDVPIEIGLSLVSRREGINADALKITAAIIGGGEQRRLEVTISPMSHPVQVGFGGNMTEPRLNWVRYYLYVSSDHWSYRANLPLGASVITPAEGENLLYVARHNSRVYEFLKELVAPLNWRVRFDQSQKTFRLSEVRADEILDYNLDLLSDSLKRLLFYGAILLTSQNAVLVLDEPDVFAFPPYPKTLGEMIAGDETNQFFLTTHNPYFLAGIVEKASRKDLAVFVCHRDDEGATAVKLLSDEGVSRVIEQGASVFFNLDDFLLS